VAELCHHLARQACVADSVHHLIDGLGRLSGGADVRLGWYEGRHIRLVAVAAASADGAATALSDAPGRSDAHWAAAMEEAIDQGQALYGSMQPGPATPWVCLAQRQLAGSADWVSMTLVLPGEPEPLGALSLVWPAGTAAPLPRDVDLWQVLASQVAPVLAWQRLAARPWHWQLRQAVRRALARADGPVHRHPRWALAVAVLAAVLLGALPLPERIGGHARVEGAQQRVLVAPSDGFIKGVHAHPGDRVSADQVLADLAEQDLRLERDKWASQLAQHDNSYAAAMTRADRADAALALSRRDEAQAQLALVDEQLQRSQLRSPFDGVLIQGDLTQSIGAPVKQGDILMTVASTDRWRVIVDVDEAEIARVRAGLPGEMALSALPWDTLALQVVRITPLAQARDGRNVFEVEAAFTAPVPAEVRPGLMGQAKLRIGARPLLWAALRPVVERVRLILWSWWG
jgi:multidrug resistance efflux pump